jgi:hypothetical protein
MPLAALAGHSQQHGQAAGQHSRPCHAYLDPLEES